MLARWCVVLNLVLAASGLATAGAPTLDTCAALARDDPGEFESYRCYWRASRLGEWDRATRALESLLAIDSSNNGALLYLAAIAKDRWEDRAETLCRRAVERFVAAGDAAGEARARILLMCLLADQRRTAESDAELEALRRAVERTDDPVLQASLETFEAVRARKRHDYATALYLLAEAEQAAFPDGPFELLAGILAERGLIYWKTGFLEKAIGEHTRQADLLHRAGDLFAESEARVQIGFLHRRRLLDGQATTVDHVELLEQALRMAVRSGNQVAELKARLQLGDTLEGPRAIAELTRSEAIARRIGARHLLPWTQRTLAGGIFRNSAAPDRREQALAWIDRAIAGSRSAGDLDGIAFGLIDRASVLDREQMHEAWTEAWLQAIAAVEKCRDLLPDDTVGKRAFSRCWSWAYVHFAQLLASGAASSPDPRGDLDLSFQITERMHSRLMLDEIDAAGAHPEPVGDPADIQRRDEILAMIASVHRRLADPSLNPADRHEQRAELERLELEEAALRETIARADPTFAALRTPEIPTLDRVQARLAADQALLCYQLGPGPKPSEQGVLGGSWLLMVTREQVRVFPLAGRKELRQWTTAGLGLCRRRDGSFATAAAHLFDELLREPLEAAGEPVRRLIIVPDGILHRIPFAALLPGIDETPIGAHYEIARVPSASAWLRGSPSAAESRPAVLAFADPEITGPAGSGPTRAALPWGEGLRLDRLPRARVESRRFVSRLGGRVIQGSAASEKKLKQTDLSDFGILHLAAHAVVDFDRPDRSAVLLTPGSPQEDGFLQMREIVELDLRGKIVVLSACRGASGEILRGEGVLGLARAFMLAGANSVFASLWPMRDDEAEALIDALSAGIARGQTLSRALTGARASLIADGAPTEAWASLVLIGDGDVVLVPGGRGANRNPLLWMTAAVGVSLLAGITAFVYRRSRV